MPGALSGAPFTEVVPDLLERPEPLTVVADIAPRRDPGVGRRVVAIAMDAMELLRPESDLARLLSSFDRVDVLFAVGETPALDDRDDPAWDDKPWDDKPWDERARDDRARDGACGDGTGRREPGSTAVPDETRERVAALGHPDLVVHRLGLVAPFAPDAEEDLVAGMSELVGFDPEPGVCCLAPAAPPTGFGMPDCAARGALDRAAQRIARVYGLPLLRYRCLELSLVPEQR